MVILGEITILKRAKTCETCGCKSKVEETVRSAVGGGTFLICPGEKKYPDIHGELEEKLENLDNEGHPKSYIRELKKEILQLERKFKKIPVLEKE